MTPTEILTILAGAVIVLGLAWYWYRGRSAGRMPGRRAGVPGDEAETEREHQRAVAAAQEGQADAMVRRYCPHCAEDVFVRKNTCVQCGYHFG